MSWSCDYPGPVSHTSSVTGEASPPGRWRASFRGPSAMVIAGLRVRGWVWWLSLLWVAIGAGGAGYAFAMTTQTCMLRQRASGGLSFPQWNGEPGVIIAVGALAAAVWILLTSQCWPPVCGDIRRYAWLGIWIAGAALMVLASVAASGWLAGNGPVDPTQPSSTWGSPGPVVGWGELPICAAWLALGAVMTWILNAPGSKNAPETAAVRPGKPTRNSSCPLRARSWGQPNGIEMYLVFRGLGRGYTGGLSPMSTSPLDPQEIRAAAEAPTSSAPIQRRGDRVVPGASRPGSHRACRRTPRTCVPRAACTASTVE